MASPTFLYLRRRLLDVEIELLQVRTQNEALAELVSKMVDRFCPELKHDAEAIDRMLFEDQTEDLKL
jgi:hypothetical protein